MNEINFKCGSTAIPPIMNLELQIATLNSQITGLQNEIEYLNLMYNNYAATHYYTEEDYANNMFTFYYVKPEQKFGVYDLETVISDLYWLQLYQEGAFDCSEMSAYLEWYLENEGWHTMIIAGDSPFGSGGHAWLLVETSQGQYMPVESTNIEVVWWSDPKFDDYFRYDEQFETIQEAIAYIESEFDWWK